MKQLKRLFVITILLLAITSCSKNDDNDSKEEFDGSIEAIENFFSDEVIQSMKELGFVFNEGTSPPIIEGEFLISVLTLESSNISNDVIGKTYADSYLKFSNQLNEKLSIDFESTTGTQRNIGVESFISGDGNKFSIFIKVNSTRDEHTTVLAIAYSALLKEDGIDNVQYTLIMLDDKGDPKGNLIENSEGRLFIDSDGFSPKQ